MKISIIVKILLAGLLLFVTGCATLDVTQKNALDTTGEKQPVTLGVQASGDGRQDAHDTSVNPAVIGIEVAGESLLDALDKSEDSIIKAASGKLFEKVLLLPKESAAMQLKEIKSAYGADYVLSVVIGDVTVKHNLNPLWFASFPMLFFQNVRPDCHVSTKCDIGCEIERCRYRSCPDAEAGRGDEYRSLPAKESPPGGQKVDLADNQQCAGIDHA